DVQSMMVALSMPGPLLVHDGAPPELARVIDRMMRQSPAERMPLADVIPALDAAVPWARWTDEQVAAELRAMLPDDYARLATETHAARHAAERVRDTIARAKP